MGSKGDENIHRQVLNDEIGTFEVTALQFIMRALLIRALLELILKH